MEKESFVKKAWVNPSRAAKKAAGDRRNIYQVISIPKLCETSTPIETRLNESKDVKVIKKEEAGQTETVTIHVKDKEEAKRERRRAEKDADVLAVIPLPDYKPLAFNGEIRDEPAVFFQVGETCKDSQVASGASRVDVLGGTTLSAKGNGALIIVWDFVPQNESAFEADEYTDRPGGRVKFYPNATSAVDDHGAQCASVAAGRLSGIAPGAQLAVLGLGTSIPNDLGIIRSVAESFGGPTIVNMSFALEWRDVGDEEEKNSIFNFMDYLNYIVKDMREENPRLMFLVAAGNETQNMCETTEPLSFDTGSDVYNKSIAWPQFARGEETPFFQVGATEVKQTNPKRKIAIYSNFGPCVRYFTHGGAVCAYSPSVKKYLALQGTSFSTPVMAGIAAVLFSQNLGQTTSDVDTRMMNEMGIATRTATGQPSLDTTDLFVQLSQDLVPADTVPPPFKELPTIEEIEVAPVPIDSSSGSPINDPDGLPENLVRVLVIALVAILFISVVQTLVAK